jgi:excinuclease ABC subunit A
MQTDRVISVGGVRVHNLRNIDVDIPVGKLTAVTGVSGAGKSSLVFDTLYAEAQRRYLQSFSVAIRQQLERFDQPDAERIGDLPPAIAVRRSSANSRGTVGSFTEISDYLRLLLTRAGTVHCPSCGQQVAPQRLDEVLAIVLALPAGRQLSLAFPSRPEAEQDVAAWAGALREDGFVRLQIDGQLVRLAETPTPALSEDATAWVVVDRIETGKITTERLRDSLETAFARGQGRLALLDGAAVQVFDRRWRCPRCDTPCPEPTPRLLDCEDPLGACPHCHGTGIEPAAAARHKKVVDGDKLPAAAPCTSCQGRRWNEQALCVRLAGKTIADLSALPLRELADVVNQTRARSEIAAILEQLQRRLAFLLDSDLGYLHLLRPLATLAGGERQRLQLGAALTNNLVGALYLLDEPAAGLHPRDLDKLIAQLCQLRDAGNTVVMIEHHASLIRAADHVIDLGPGAGEEGGRVVAQGSAESLADVTESVTGEFLSGTAAIVAPSSRRRPQHWLHLEGANLHNLQNLSVDFPLGVLCAVTGVSGAGKSSLVEHTLVPCLAKVKGRKAAAAPPAGAELRGAGQIEDVLWMDQEPLSRSARSNPATYLKLLDDIRDLFADTAEAKIRGFAAGHFSFNQPGGRCEVCEGQGVLTVDMQFLADVTMTCPECQGRRFKKDILNVKVRSLNVAEVLNLTVREAFRFFRAQRGLQRKLKWLLDVGLDYVRLGQATDTLSGGESQRLKLAGHLASSRKPRCLFILIEPTAGLHPADTQCLLDCFDRLVQTGHTVLVIEHNLDMIKCADYVIDMGPGAGPDGGRVVATGTPKEIVEVAASQTGHWLLQVLQ